MDSIWVGIHPRPEGTRILATTGPTETLLKARLRFDPQHPRALPMLLEALALWQGLQVRGALAVDESAASSGTSPFRDCLLDFGQTPLYRLDVVPFLRRPRRRDDLGGMGNFRDLRQLLLFEVAR